MKHIIIDGGDNLGKDTLIKSIADFFKKDNISFRHFDKPPKPDKLPEDMTPIKFQMACFNIEANLIHQFRSLNETVFKYHDNTVIWNRSHLGEYVYGSMFRGYDKEDLKEYIESYEKIRLEADDKTYLILLTASPEFFFENEDGESFSQTLEEKEKELNLFKEVFDISTIKNKVIVKVDDGFKKFKPKQDIFLEAMKHIDIL